MNRTLIACLLVIVFLFSTCKKVEKDVNNYYPKVKTISATKLPDGTVRVTGQIVSGGSTPIKYAGFCMDTKPNPDMQQNQVLATNITEDTFTYIYSNFDAFKKYYFRAWVANTNGYAIDSDVSADKITLDISLVPCQLNIGILSLTDTNTIIEAFSYVAPVNPASSDFNAYTKNHNIYFRFGRVPFSGIFHTTDADYPDNSSVMIMVDGNRAAAGANVYVRQISSTIIELTICQITYKLNVGGIDRAFTLNTKFWSPG